MLIKQLYIEGFRNLEQVTLPLDPNLNVFVGLNGSGKTSLLESICFLVLGRSFRLSSQDGLINFNQPFAAVSAIYCDLGSQQIKINTIKYKNQEKTNKIGGSLASLFQIAQIAPTQIVHESSSKLIFAEPEGRRKFLDWIVFYANEGYHDLWREFNRVLQQRNSLLKQHNHAVFSVIKEIDKVFVGLAEKITAMRDAVWRGFLAVWERCFLELDFDVNIKPEIKLVHGWDGDLLQVLAANLNSDLKHGFTSVGPQRADLQFSINHKKAKDILSRGQGKAVTLSLILARAIFLNRVSDNLNTGSVLLIDDLCAELDNVNGKKITDFLINPNYKLQVFITGINEAELLKVLPKSYGQWFRIQQGEVKIYL